MRTINGAFIQLPWSAHLDVPGNANYINSRRSAPNKEFAYETRYGRDSAESDRPRFRLSVMGSGQESWSWREINNANF